MKLSDSKYFISLFTFLLVALMILQGCGNDNVSNISPPDFSTVPEPFDTTAAVSTENRENGLLIYTIEEGSEEIPPVVTRDQVLVYYTGRTAEGEIFSSTYADGNTSPSRLNNLTPLSTQQSSSLIEGFRQALLGMKEGEKRTVVIPPSLGYGESTPGTNGYNLRNSTLIYDIYLDRILD